MKFESELIALTDAMVRLGLDRSARALVERDGVRERIRLIGGTAAFVGGFDGMTKLSDACEEISPGTGSVLNLAWDGIGDWWA